MEYVSHWHYRIKEGLKLAILFRVARGEHMGVEIVRLYNVKPASGKRKWQAFRAGALWAEFCVVMHGYLDTTKLRLDELPISRMKGLRILAEIRTVKKNRDEVRLLGGAAYSVVQNLFASEIEDEDYIPLHAKPSPSPSLTPAPSGLAGERVSAKATEKAMGKNRGTNWESKDDEKKEPFPVNVMRWDD